MTLAAGWQTLACGHDGEVPGLWGPDREWARIADIAALATFLASDAGVSITGTWINATAGMFPS